MIGDGDLVASRENAVTGDDEDLLRICEPS